MDSSGGNGERGRFGDEKDLFWFSHFTKEYEVVRKFSGRKEFLILEDKPLIKLDWDNCSIDIARVYPESGLVRFVVRSSTNRNRYRNPVERVYDKIVSAFKGITNPIRGFESALRRIEISVRIRPQ